MKHCILGFFICFLTIAFGQSQEQDFRKFRRFSTTYGDIVKIGEQNPTFLSENISIIIAKREEFCPHFPLSENVFVFNETQNQEIKDWISNYPVEYKSYIDFLEKLIRTNH